VEKPALAGLKNWPTLCVYYLEWSRESLFSKKGIAMKHGFAMGVLAVTALALSSTFAGDTLKSGLPPGGKCTPFHPLNVTGPFAGMKQCLV
jgi:hypothetical protein